MRSKPRLPPLGSLRAFEAAARLSSFRLAGDELGVTQSAISHRIAEVEAELGVKLFERLPRGVKLTDAGMLYYPYIFEAFERVTRGTALIKRIGTKDDLAIETYATIAIRWLIPRLAGFRQINPALAIRIGTSQLDWELNIDSSDIGILYMTRPERPNLHYHMLMKAQLFPVCSPQIASQIDPHHGHQSLQALPRLALYTAPEEWNLWLEAAGETQAAFPVTLTFDTYLTALQSALDGHGIALAPDFLVADDLKAGRLIAPFTLQVAQPGAWYAICRKERTGEPRISQFLDWLTEQFTPRPPSF